MALAVLPFVASVALGQVAPTSAVEGRAGYSAAALTDMLRKHPNDGALWFELGAVRAQKGEGELAVAAFEKAARNLSDKRAAYHNIVALDLARNDAAAAIPWCREALKVEPQDRDLLQNYVFALMSTSQDAEATPALETLKRLDPTNVAVRVSLVEVLERSGHVAESDEELRKIFDESLLTRSQAVALAANFSRDKEEHSAQLTAAWIGQRWPGAGTPAASPLAAAGEQTGSAELSAIVARVASLIRSERYADASQTLMQAREQFPQQPELEYESALTDMCLQRFDKALATLSQLKQQQPPSARVEFLMGGAYEITGRTPEAASAYRQAAALDPNNVTYLRPLCALLQKQGHDAESVPILRHALATDPDDSQSLVLLAHALEKQGALDEATSLLKHAAQSDPSSRRAHAALAEIYFRQKRLEDAEQEQALAAKLEDQRIQQWNIWGTTPTNTN